MKHRVKALIAAITLLIMLPFTATPSHAFIDYFPPIRQGSPSIGILNSTPDSSVVLESQTVRFNLADYPKFEYENPDEFKDYSATVTSEYTLFNPTEETELLILTVPTHMSPDYGANDPTRFELLVNGEMIDGETKYASSNPGYDLGFNPTVDLFIDPEDINDDNKYSYLSCYVYEVEIDPGEKMSIVLTTPVYPHVSQEYEPESYKYSYYFSTYELWAEYGSVDVIIDTDYHMLEAEYNRFTKYDGGYTLHIGDLKNELDGNVSIERSVNFSLSSVEEPERTEPDNSGIGIIIILMLIIMPFVALWEGIEDVVEIIVNGIKDIFKK